MRVHIHRSVDQRSSIERGRTTPREADVFALQRLAGNDAVARLLRTRSTRRPRPARVLLAAQRQRYVTHRELPLRQASNPKDRTDALKKIKFALRQKYGDDQEGYQRALAEAHREMAGHGEQIPLRKAHVGGIDTSKRKRAGNQAKKISDLEERHQQFLGGAVSWIGAHLVKDAWGGEDNMWNVVAWPRSTEDLWAERFEDPIDLAFQLGEADMARIEITVEKEDEAWSADAVASVLDSHPGMARLDPAQREYAQGKVEAARWQANRAIESVPVNVTARSTKTPRFSFGPGDTMWTRARLLGLREIDQSIDDVLAQIGGGGVDPRALQHRKTRAQTAQKGKASRTDERARAHAQEQQNLRPDEDVYDVD